MSTFFTSENSSTSYLYDILMNTTNENLTFFTDTMTKEEQDRMNVEINKITNKLSNIFRRMIVNKRAIQENMDDLSIYVHRYESDGNDEVSFFT